MAPDFELRDQHGQARRLSALLVDGPVVLFFYPGADTPICTVEACHFRDLAADFAAAGAQRIGISADGVQAQADFAAKRGLDYPLLSDPDGAVAAQFGVKRGLLGKFAPVKRTTFVIGEDRTVLEVIASELRANEHADRALKFLSTRKGPDGPGATKGPADR